MQLLRKRERINLSCRLILKNFLRCKYLSKFNHENMFSRNELSTLLEVIDNFDFTKIIQNLYSTIEAANEFICCGSLKPLSETNSVSCVFVMFIELI